MKSAIILDSVAQAFGVSVREIMGKTRERPVARARQAAYYLCREFTSLSYPRIGAKFNRDHSTVMYGVKQVGHLRFRNPEFDRKIVSAEARITRRLMERRPVDDVRRLQAPL